MDIILKKDVANLGHADDVVKVKTGYAMNYLIPQGFAIAATPSALKQHEETLRQRAHKEAKKVAEAEAAAAKINELTVKVSAKVSENGKIYGSVTTAQLAEALVAAGVEVDKKDITILSEVKELGNYEAAVDRIRKNLSLRCVTFSWHFSSLLLELNRYSLTAPVIFFRQQIQLPYSPASPRGALYIKECLVLVIINNCSETF